MQARKTRILAELPVYLLNHYRPWVVAGLLGIPLFGVVAATTATQDPVLPFEPTRVVETLSPQLQALAAPADLPYIHDDRVRSGDTIATIFRRLGVNDPDALALLLRSSEGQAALRQLRAGRSVTAALRSTGEVEMLSLPVGQTGERLTIERDEKGELQVRAQDAAETTTLVEMQSGVIRHSLFGATDAVGMPDSVASKLADLFGTEIDFHTDLRRGDEFRVIYEMVYVDGSPVSSGRILAAEFINQGKKYAVVLYRNAEGNERYYTMDGRSLQQAFLRSPLEFSRVTSNFGRRLHPIRRDWRDHRGVDFGAPTGTAVKATSDGVVDFVGTQSGYGNIIVLRHRGSYTTAYAHLNGFARGLLKGMKVDQGTVIGYVGSTGWATGPHLHYEVRVKGTAQDPMRIALPTAEPLSPAELTAFRQTVAPMQERLTLLNRPQVEVASN